MHLYMALCGVLHLSAVSQSAAVRQDTGAVSASVGDNVTLRCFYESQVAMHFSWYRHTLGSGPELLSSIYKFDKPSKVYPWMEKNPRFSVQRQEGMNHLHISDVRFSDSASYFCGSSHSNIMELGEGVFLSVKGADLNWIVQGPASETIQPGGSVTFSCTVHAGTCNGEHHLRRPNLSSSDAGTYCCAVASCGQVLLGNGTQLLIEDDVEDQMRVLVWLSIIRTGTLLLFITAFLLFYVTKSR
ncbi:immunoglobulin kappa light chain-like [Enoplosus armatus]|uniref:immunoglobulin kappa light chain-like n=1 Tax=Enoplosus armatus TaxID=215367 RepID=UPI00399143E7